jgi:hypothetical protein
VEVGIHLYRAVQSRKGDFKVGTACEYIGKIRKFFPFLSFVNKMRKFSLPFLFYSFFKKLDTKGNYFLTR